MRKITGILLALLCCTAMAHAQTAEELVAKNIAAKGGLEKIKAVQSLRLTGRMDDHGTRMQYSSQSKRPDRLRQNISIQGMTLIIAYDSSSGWQINPFGGRRDPEMLGEDDMRSLVEDADFDGPLVDAAAKGNKIDYLGRYAIDGDDAYRLKVTLKNGDIIYYYLDPETFLEFRTEKQMFIRGSVRESVTEYGSYKPVNGVMFAYATESGPKDNPANRQRSTIDKIEVNLPVDEAIFKMPSAAAAKPPVNVPKK